MTRIKTKAGAIIEFTEMQVGTTIMIEPQLYWINLKVIPSRSLKGGFVKYDKAFASMDGVPQSFADLITDHKITRYSGKVRLTGGEYLNSPLCEFVELRDGEPDRVARKEREAAQKKAAEDDVANYLAEHLQTFIASRQESVMTFVPNDDGRQSKVTENVYFYNNEEPEEGKETRFVFKHNKLGWSIRRGVVTNGELGHVGGSSFSNEADFELAQAKLLLIYRRLNTEEQEDPAIIRRIRRRA